MHFAMTNQMTAPISGVATRKITASFTSTKNAMTIAPTTMNGERKNRRKPKFTPDCA